MILAKSVVGLFILVISAGPYPVVAVAHDLDLTDGEEAHQHLRHDPAGDRALVQKIKHSGICAKRCATNCRGKPNLDKCAGTFITNHCFPFSATTKALVKKKCLASLACQGGKICPDKSCAMPGNCCPNEKKCSSGTCVGVGTCCPGERRCSSGTCVGVGTCCPGERRCSNGTCVGVGKCCPNERLCAKGSCVGTGKCCPEEKTCPGGQCIPPSSFNVTCASLKVASDFWSFINKTDSAEAAFNTIDPALLNGLVDTIRSMVGKEMEARITPDRVINLMYPNPNATIDLSNLLNLSMAAQEGNRALALYDPRMSGSRSLLPALYNPGSASRELLSADCTVAFIDLFTNIVFVLLACIGLYSSVGGKAAVKAMIAAGGAKYVSSMYSATFSSLKILRGAWGKNPRALALFLFNSMQYIANASGMKLSLAAYFKEIGGWGAALGGATMLLSLAIFLLTDGTSIFVTIAAALMNVPGLISSGIKVYDKCFGPDACKVRRELAADLIDCDDGNKCTFDEVYCASGGWACRHLPITCLEGLNCDRTDGKCKSSDEVVPCVAVIDEDSSFGIPDQATLWTEFRTAYAYRPFCLLVPAPTTSNLHIPPSFLSDNFAAVIANVTRDYGDPGKVSDWYRLCAIDKYNAATTDSVGLFVDDSGSMQKSQVQASYDLFVSQVQNAGIQVREVVNGNENWILPFITTLVPSSPCVAEGKPGECVLLSKCESLYQKSVPFKFGDPEPNCRKLPWEYQCCIPYSCTAEGTQGDCLPTAKCQALGKRSVPWKSGDPEPSCHALPLDVQCCI